MSTPHPFEGRPDRAFLVAILAVIIAAALGITSLVLVLSERDAQQRRLQDAFCGLVVPIGEQPIGTATTPTGRKLVAGAARAADVINCPPSEGP